MTDNTIFSDFIKHLGIPPITFVLREKLSSRKWKRQHNFKDSQRYPMTETELDDVIASQQSVIKEVFAKTSPLALVTIFENEVLPKGLLGSFNSTYRIDMHNLLPEHYDKDTFATIVNLGKVTYSDRKLILCLKSVATDALSNLVICDHSFSKFVCPYPGGIDYLK